MNRERTTRRVATRSTRANDENAVPSRSHAGTSRNAAKAVVANGSSKPSEPVKVGVKRERNVLGAVTNIRDDTVVEAKKPARVTREARQPLGNRSNSAQERPIAPVPQRGRTAPAPISVELSAPVQVVINDEVVMSEMDVDRVGGAVEVDVEGLMGEDEMGDVPSEEYLEEEDDEDDWLRMAPEQEHACQRELQAVRETFQDDIDLYDTTMVAEYADEIFAHMEEMELSTMPNPRYMDFQTEVEWNMRTTLIDWLLQVHVRYHLLPETLWIAVNLVDRFLSVRVVSLNKLQLVGVTAMFIAAKYEEILAPSVDEFVYMTENGYTKDEILKGERIILQTLDFSISSYCSPYSWVRRISKADDYDIQTRTLSKFLMEVTLLDHRFLRCKPSMIAAIGMYLSRCMLGGDWNEAFVFYSNYTEAQLMPAAMLLCERLAENGFEKVYVYKKYSTKKFLRASTFACDWAYNNAATFWARE